MVTFSSYLCLRIAVLCYLPDHLTARDVVGGCLQKNISSLSLPFSDFVFGVFPSLACHWEDNSRYGGRDWLVSLRSMVQELAQTCLGATPNAPQSTV